MVFEDMIYCSVFHCREKPVLLRETSFVKSCKGSVTMNPCRSGFVPGVLFFEFLFRPIGVSHFHPNLHLGDHNEQGGC